MEFFLLRGQLLVHLPYIHIFMYVFCFLFVDFVDEVTFIEELQKEYDVKSESKGTKTPVHISQATLEVLVVVDRYVVNFHGYDSIENYVLTMMKMVQENHLYILI